MISGICFKIIRGVGDVESGWEESHKIGCEWATGQLAGVHVCLSTSGPFFYNKKSQRIGKIISVIQMFTTN